MQVLISVLSGVFLGFVTSLLFMYFSAWFLRPRIEIAPEMSRSISAEGHTILKVKIRNASSRPLTNVRAELYRVRYEYREGGNIRIVKRVPLLRNDPLFIAGVDIEHHANCYIFRSENSQLVSNLILSLFETYPNSEIGFRMVADDGFSGITRAVKKEYSTQKEIVLGQFSKGQELYIAK